MYSYIKSIGFVYFMKTEALPMSLALIIAQIFYQFGSFFLELTCFFLTLYVLSYLTHTIKR